MGKNCLYCKAEIEDKSVIDFCERCGVGVFGKKMFDAIVQNMENAQKNGDLALNDHKNLEGYGKISV